MKCKNCKKEFLPPNPDDKRFKYCSEKCRRGYSYKTYVTKQENRDKIKQRTRKYYLSHKEHLAKMSIKWREQNKEKVHQYARNHKQKRRKQVIEYLGGKCINCGISDWRLLQVNHINGGGNEERRIRTNYKTWEQILNGERSGEFDVRCANCNILHEYEIGVFVE